MSHFNQYGNYYDPVGSQPARPSEYSSQTSPSTAAYRSSANSSYGSGHGSRYQRSDTGAYNNHQYRTATSQQSTSSANHAAQALSSLSSQDYTHTSSGRSNTNNQYDNSSWYPGTNSNVYVQSGMSVPNRTQSNNSPLYPTAQSSSTFGRMSIPDPSQSSSNTFGGSQSFQSVNPSTVPSSNRSYQTAYTQQQQTQPPRYNSPLHAVQAQQHGHGKQTSRGSNHLPSPQMAHAPQNAQNRQQSASVEPSPMTVDPSQVYDKRAELQRKAQIEAEKRRKHEAEQAAKRAEEEQRKEEEAVKKKAEEEAAAKKAEQQKRKNEQRKKAREEKKQGNSAATTLQQMASLMDGAADGGGDEEEMREMFKKMREFNQKNPALLAKLWDEERKTHSEASKAQQQQPLAATASSPPAPAQAASSTQQPSKATSKAATASKAKNAISNLTKGPSAPFAQQQPGKAPVANTSLWPPHKKSSLSEATAKWLNALPDNANAQVASQSVLNILNANPSYVELCRSLESLGLKFDRSQLARELLKAVPDGMKAQPAAQVAGPLTNVSGGAPQVNGSSASPSALRGRGRPRKDSTNQGATRPDSASGTVNYEAPLSLSDAAREVNSMGQQSFQPNYGSPQQQQYQGPYFAQPPQTQTLTQTLTNGSREPSQSQPPEIKEDIKPEEPSRPPADKEEAARKRTFGDLVDLTAEDSDDDAPPPKKVMQAPPGPVNGANNQNQYLQKPTSFNQFMYKPTGRNMSTSPYFQGNANGQMPPPQIPSQQPPNAAQPVQPTLPPPPKQKGPTQEHLQQARMRGKMLVEPIMRDRVARKSNYDSRTIARDVLLATGRHPDMRGLNAHMAAMQKVLGAHGGEYDSGGNRSDLATIKWEIIDPEVPKGEGEKREAERDGVLRPASRSKVEGQTNTVRDVSNVPKDPSARLPGIKAKRGRPPGRPPRHSMPEKATQPSINGSPKASTPARQTSRPTNPSSAPTAAADMSSGAAVGYAAFNQVNPDGTKKKGRPFGWKKSLHSREAQGLPKAKPYAAAAPSRLKQSSTPKAQALQPHYSEYLCGWEGCKSSLINLDTLKKHLLKVHGVANESRGYECWWSDCRKKGKGFKDLETWMGHVDEEHVRPVAWKLGDGPRGGVASGEDALQDTLAVI